MKIFVSSVRRGLEEERDALPGLIQALGHEPRRFEDYTAQPIPSRQACLDGVEQADAYILLLGERYGDPLPDTGKAPTEEEFAVAKRRGIPILAFRKTGVQAESAQEDFVRRIEAYSTGLFRKGFANAAQLLPEVARAVRELEHAPAGLVFAPLAGPSATRWRAFERHGWRSTATIIELVATPVPPTTLAATVLTALPARLARAGREHGLFDEAHGLETGVENSSAFAATRPDRYVPIAGIGLSPGTAVSVWQELASDMLGVILDQADVARWISRMAPIAAEFVPTGSPVTFAIGLHHLGSVVEGTVTDLGHRNSAQMAGFGLDKSVLVDGTETVPVGAIARAAPEIGNEMAARLVLAFRDTFRR